MEKSIAEYYIHEAMRDGHVNICKECKIIDSQIYNKTERGRATEKKRNQTKKRKKYSKARLRIWRENNREKGIAHSKIGYAVRSGKIKKPNNCACCGIGGPLHGHHEDYNDPLVVIWLCPGCHVAVHNKKFAFIEGIYND